ncbi:uncharacterized protein LOC130810013 [Amaranthus tricolor]|uniref:uncharacterized protein LOC130810013 n=1 Tax=Amaranthus tricolor TaxID=29722 RepID=UPI002582918C|nr:uncharacterized protein LOC130810013 [Amaranthus tricolor]
MASFLVGPPSPHTNQPTTTTDNPFINHMVSNFNSLHTYPSTMGQTRNNSATYLSTGNPCLDLFFNDVPNTPSDSLIDRLNLAWSYSPLTTLKLICNLRGVRGTGKSDKNGFYTAAIWLHENHPQALACNLESFVRFGYLKDLLEILFRVLGFTHPAKMGKQYGTGFQSFKPLKYSRKRKVQKSMASAAREARITASIETQAREKQEARKLRHSKRSDMAKTALERYKSDYDYRFLHDKVSNLFSSHLIIDMENLKSGKLNKISLAAKWCPSLDSCYDRATLLCEAIAKKVFPRDKYEEYSGVEEAHYAYRVRDRLRKDILVPLRRALQLPEVFMSENRWTELPYNRVSSVAMKTYKEIFLNHDEKRFVDYLNRVRSKKAKISAGGLLPHEIISLLNDGDGGMVAELQWKRMVEDLSKEGKLNNCIAVCDVSRSMEGTSMEACVSLGLLLSELSETPWKGKVITFSENPHLHLIEGDDLRSKIQFIKKIESGKKPDFQKVFDLILRVAVDGKVNGDQMIKKVFVFSNMEFDKASENPWETDYHVIRRKYEEEGYGDYIPEIVFWRMQDSMSIPVFKKQKGAVLVSGYSKNVMKLFINGKCKEVNPEALMEVAISGDEFGQLIVFKDDGRVYVSGSSYGGGRGRGWSRGRGRGRGREWNTPTPVDQDPYGYGGRVNMSTRVLD